MSARTGRSRARVVESGWLSRAIREQLSDLAEKYPAGTRIVHAGGREGTVAADHPDHVPGWHLGGPSTVCLAGPALGEPMVFATWDNEYDLVWRAWVPVSKVHTGTAPAVNRPGNTARIGATR